MGERAVRQPSCPRCASWRSSPFRTASAPTRARGRDGKRRRAAERDPAPARPRESGRDFWSICRGSTPRRSSRRYARVGDRLSLRLRRCSRSSSAFRPNRYSELLAVRRLCGVVPVTPPGAARFSSGVYGSPFSPDSRAGAPGRVVRLPLLGGENAPSRDGLRFWFNASARPMLSRVLRLVTIPISHYCEKVRWALERAGIPYREERHVQGIHRIAARRAGGGATVPVLVTPTACSAIRRKSSPGSTSAHPRSTGCSPTTRTSVPTSNGCVDVSMRASGRPAGD